MSETEAQDAERVALIRRALEMLPEGALPRAYFDEYAPEWVAWLLEGRERQDEALGAAHYQLADLWTQERARAAQLERQAAELERLRVALAPFADHARAYNERVATLTDADLDVCEGHSIRISDCRRALAALSAAAETEEPE
jgi:hypothetical protein